MENQFLTTVLPLSKLKKILVFSICIEILHTSNNDNINVFIETSNKFLLSVK